MNVLLSVYACDPSRGGEFNNGWNYAQNASEEFRIWCLTTIEGKKGITERLNSEPNKYLHIVYVEVPDWLLRLKEKSPQVGVYFHYIYWQYKAYKVASDLSEEVNFDVIHHGTYASLQLGSFLWKLNKPMIFGPVGGGQNAPPGFRRYFGGGFALEKIRDIIGFGLLKVFRDISNVVRKADLILTVNQDTYELARKYGAKRIEYAPCTLLPDNYGPVTIPVRNPSNDLRILWVGRLIPRKGLLLMLESLACLGNRIPFKFTIIGDGPQKTQLLRWIAELKLNDKVDYLGRRPMEEVMKAYRAHDVFLYCSLRESLAAQFFEAKAFGIPMVTLDLHGAKTFVDEGTAIKVPVTTPEDTKNQICKALIKLYEEPELRKKISTSSFSSAKDFKRSERLKYINNYYRLLSDVRADSI